MFHKLTLVALTTVAIANGAPKISLQNKFLGGLGNQLHQQDPYIVGGEIVEGRQYPSVISLRVYGYHYCGGSILNKEWILTAAHCSGSYPDEYYVITGSNSLLEGGNEYKVVEVHAHVNFSYDTTNDDIAVMKVSPPMVLGNGVEAVRLPQKGQETPDGSDAIVIGWGNIATGGPGSNDLREASVKISDQQICNRTYGNVITHTQICAGWDEGGKDACNGDSGGPLYVNNEIVGIVSWGQPCAIKGYPTVYTRVAQYIDWIEENTKA